MVISSSWLSPNERRASTYLPRHDNDVIIIYWLRELRVFRAEPRPNGCRHPVSLARRRGQLDHPERQVDLEDRWPGHLVLAGCLGSEPVHVLISPYAQCRMKQRDIDALEVLEALALPRSSHGAGKTPGRFEAAGRTSRGRLRVIYKRPRPEVVLVITTHTESD